MVKFTAVKIVVMKFYNSGKKYRDHPYNCVNDNSGWG
ncbi:hypothetical protein SAMN05444405_11144 [Bacteroides luti]|uniref:Uncharacterized protein n=1 Tax=Bacteroides luti TaxID=1297750 RepID=A0A1M5D2X7_9BACE|nr:hypothetical protein SAMN05444405_11144 [Bacteroides luti]